VKESQSSLETELAELRSKIEQLEGQLARRRVSAVRRVVTMTIVVALLVGGGAVFAHLADSQGAALQQYMDYSTPHITAPPLDSMVRWGRRDIVNAQPGFTNQILSLIADANQKNSHTWPLYIQLSATNSPEATLQSSGSVGAYVRAFNRSTGSPWVAGYHSEIYHGFTALGGQQVEANGTSILFNGEMLTKSQHGLTVGLNLQNTVDSTGPATHAINIQAANATATWQNGIHFDGAGVVGNTGINFDNAKFQKQGINLGDNSIALNAGQRVYLDASGKTYLSYNPAISKIELVRAGQRVGTW
jgi:hypothetical protein